MLAYKAHNTEANIYQRIASGGEKTIGSALQLLVDNGWGPDDLPISRRELAISLESLAINGGSDVKTKVIELHPDKETILAAMATLSPLVVKTKNDCGCQQHTQTHHNDCGCQKHHSDIGAAGLTVSQPAMTMPTNNFDLQSFAMILILTVGGLAFITAILGQTYVHMHKMKN